MNSCLYEGQVRHRRYTPRAHEFEYRIFLLWLDLDELDTVFDHYLLWSVNRFNIASFRREDHLGEPAVSLKQSVSELVEQHTGSSPRGPIRLLTHLRYAGYGFNPVSFYYCYDEQDKYVETIVAEVNNTPWGEQHCYVLSENDNTGEGAFKRYTPAKAFHVSPFMPMNIDYDWRFAPVNETLNVHMENYRDGDKLFDATMMLDRKVISSKSLASVLIRFPLVTAKVTFGIYYQALRLWLKKTPFYNHPNDKEAPQSASNL